MITNSCSPGSLLYIGKLAVLIWLGVLLGLPPPVVLPFVVVVFEPDLAFPSSWEAVTEVADVSLMECWFWERESWRRRFSIDLRVHRRVNIIRRKRTTTTAGIWYIFHSNWILNLVVVNWRDSENLSVKYLWENKTKAYPYLRRQTLIIIRVSPNNGQGGSLYTNLKR